MVMVLMLTVYQEKRSEVQHGNHEIIDSKGR